VGLDRADGAKIGDEQLIVSTAYTKPFTVSVHQQIMLNTDLIEFICSENNRSDAHLVGK
jgi:hypothetical protein